MNDVMKIIKEEQLNVLSQDFDTKCQITFEVRKSNLNQVLNKLDKVEGLKTVYLGTV